MADISMEQQAWKDAVYGEDVRNAEIALNDKINAEVEAGTARIEEYGRKETERNTAEQSRAAAEPIRVEEEKKRDKAETDRVTEFAGIKATAENVTREAGEAAENANAKAALANSAATAANSAASTASTKATLADSKATLANNAATAADTAKNDANKAATNANDKAVLADKAVTTANTAAERANAAAKSAEDVVTGTGLIPTAQKGTANGVATLDANGKVPVIQLENVTKTLVGLESVPNVATNDQTPTYAQASTRTNLSSGEKLSIALGKIKKWFADMRGAAFCDVANNQTTTAAGYVLDARQGKAIYTTISDLSNRMDGLNRNLQTEIISVSNTFTTNDTFTMENSYLRGEKEAFLQFSVRANVTLPTSTNLFRLSTPRAYPKSIQQVPAILHTNNLYMPWHVEIMPDGYVRQNGGSAVTEIWVCGRYVI